MKYSIIIPTYNHCDDLLKPCVSAVLKYTHMNDVELIISANGCVDNTRSYLIELKQKFEELGFEKNLIVVWNDNPIGYSKANNEALRFATGEKIILLNNDAFLLPQEKNTWISMMEQPFINDPKCGLSGPLMGPSQPAGQDFIIFFCVMIDRKVFDKIGYLNEEYGKGGGEDTEFCIEAKRAGFTLHECDVEKQWSEEMMLYVGLFPIYHRGEATVFDTTLVPDWGNVFYRNSLLLGRKYNRDWYRWKLSNDGERGVFLKGDFVFNRERTRYSYASEQLIGTKVLDIGCSSGFGVQFLPQNIDYTGVDYDPIIIEAAIHEQWRENIKFLQCDINNFELEQYDTIIAFEVIEHMDNGLEVVERLKKHCKRLILTVPYMEPPGFWGHYHKLHQLNESHFPGFQFKYINENGDILDEKSDSPFHLLLMVWCNND